MLQHGPVLGLTIRFLKTFPNAAPLGLLDTAETCSRLYATIL
jgi:hypothetical protein